MGQGTGLGLKIRPVLAFCVSSVGTSLLHPPGSYSSVSEELVYTRGPIYSETSPLERDKRCHRPPVLSH